MEEENKEEIKEEEKKEIKKEEKKEQMPTTGDKVPQKKATSEQPQIKKCAYVIGNFKYPGHTGLGCIDWVEEDAKQMKKYLDYNGFHITSILNCSKFGFSQIEKQITNLAKNTLAKFQTAAITTDNKTFDIIGLIQNIIKYTHTHITGFIDGCQFNVQEIKKSQALIDCKGSYQLVHCQMPKFETLTQTDTSSRKVASATYKYLKFAAKSKQLQFKYQLIDFIASQSNNTDAMAEILFKTGSGSQDSFNLKFPIEEKENVTEAFTDPNKEEKEEKKIDGVNDLGLYLDEDLLERVIRYNEGDYIEQLEQIKMLKEMVMNRNHSDLLRDTCMVWLGWCHLFPLGDYEEDEKKAVEIFTSHQHTPLGLFSLAMTYYHGYAELEKDFTQAYYYASKSAYQGDRRGIGLLGYMNHLGISGEQKMVEALILYEKASDLGNANAMYNLGICYYNGDGVIQDQTKAIEYYRMSAERYYQGAIDTLFELGIDFLKEKKDKEEEEEKARKLEEQEAAGSGEQGEEEGQQYHLEKLKTENSKRSSLAESVEYSDKNFSASPRKLKKQSLLPNIHQKQQSFGPVSISQNNSGVYNKNSSSIFQKNNSNLINSNTNTNNNNINNNSGSIMANNSAVYTRNSKINPQLNKALINKNLKSGLSLQQQQQLKQQQQPLSLRKGNSTNTQSYTGKLMMSQQVKKK